MQVKLTVEIHADIPGEFQDNDEAIKLLQDEIDELLSIGAEYDKYDQPSVMFTSADIKVYTPGAGKL